MLNRLAAAAVAITLTVAPAGTAAARSGAAPSAPPLTAAELPAAKAKTGNLKVVITGLPKKAKAKVLVNGAGIKKKVTASKTLTKLKVFVYDVTVEDLKYGKYWYRGVSQSTTKAVTKGKTATVRIRYSKASSPTPAPETGPRFSLGNTVAVGIRASGPASGYGKRLSLATTPGTNLVAVHSDNTTGSALRLGSLNVSQTAIGPDGSLYLALASPQNFETGSVEFNAACALGRVRPGNDRGECVDQAIAEVPPLQAADMYGLIGNPTIQFDASGAVYYLARRKDQSNGPGGSIYRNANGVITNLTPAGVGASDFLVAPDGTVLLSGGTMGGSWVRRISAGGQVTNLVTHNTNFLRAFSDGNVYFSDLGSGAIQRYRSDARAMDPAPWLGSCLIGADDPTATHSCATMLDATGERDQFVNVSTTQPLALVNLANGQAIGPLRDSRATPSTVERGWIMRYYPVPALFRSSVKTPTLSVAAGDELVVAGTTASGTPRLIAFDSASGGERVLLDGQVKFAHLAYSASTASIRFSGVRVSDGAVVIGSVGLSSGAVDLQVTSERFSDLEGL